MNLLIRLAHTLAFLTVVPVPRRLLALREPMPSMAFFPAVGVLVGALGWGVAFLSGAFFSPLVSACFVCAAWWLLSGGLHAEGFVDMVDGLSAPGDREAALRVMKDPQCGAKGAVAAALLAVTKVALVAEAIGVGSLGWILAAAVGGRLGMVILAGRCCYARAEGGMGKAFVENAGMRQMALALIQAVVVALIVVGGRGVVCMCALAAFFVLAAGYFQKRLGGVTGDILGAGSEIGECVFLAFCALGGAR